MDDPPPPIPGYPRAAAQRVQRRPWHSVAGADRRRQNNGGF